MKPIPLNILTVYADLLQSLELGGNDSASIATKTVKGKRFVYATTKDGSARIERYLGPADDEEVKQNVELLKQGAERAKSRRSTVTLLKNAKLPAPIIVLGRILEVISNAGLFERGMTLIGTAAYQTYAGIVGHFLPAATYSTQDADISLVEFVPGEDEEDFESILKRADPTFQPVWNSNDPLPKVFRASNGFSVDLLTRYGRGRRSPVPVESIGVSAVPLNFQEYVSAETIQAVALYNSGVLVKVPTPAKFAVHKLIVAQQRSSTQVAKKQKDLRQARELIDILLATDEQALQDTLDDARAHGKSWKSAIASSLKEIGRDNRQGRLPLPLPTKGSRTAMN